MAEHAARAVDLVPFAAPPDAAVRAIHVQVSRPAPERLLLEYTLTGDMTRLEVPAPRAEPPREPTESLWRHTCMECFVSSSPRGPYLEFNFSPSGEWAAYRFSGYREGMTPVPLTRPPRISARAGEGLQVLADVALPAALAAYELTLGITVVARSRDGGLSYWAIRHPGERPDFHHAAGFGLEI